MHLHTLLHCMPKSIHPRLLDLLGHDGIIMSGCVKKVGQGSTRHNGYKGEPRVGGWNEEQPRGDVPDIDKGQGVKISVVATHLLKKPKRTKLKIL